MDKGVNLAMIHIPVLAHPSLSLILGAPKQGDKKKKASTSKSPLNLVRTKVKVGLTPLKYFN